MSSVESILTTFLASLRSVGTACTLSAVGVYLHRRNFIIGEGKRTLALISQQVTIPAFLFTKVVYCNQDWSDAPCPNVMDNMADIWALLLWPGYVVGCGIVVGYLAAKVSRTPQRQVRSVLAACAFGNSTGLPITLLTVIHANFPATTELGAVDPTLFLSVYLLLYPVLQWGVGGWLLAPEEEIMSSTTSNVLRANKSAGNGTVAGQNVGDGSGWGLPQEVSAVRRRKSAPPERRLSRGRSLRNSLRGSIKKSARNVLNNSAMMEFYSESRRGLLESDASLYISNTDLVGMGKTSRRNREEEVEMQLHLSPQPSEDDGENDAPCIEDDFPSAAPSVPSPPHLPQKPSVKHVHYAGVPPGHDGPGERTPLVQHPAPPVCGDNGDKENTFRDEPTCGDDDDDDDNNSDLGLAPLLETLKQILSRCLQPPVVGALLGLIVAAIPELRGIFVDLVNRADAAPLEWMFDGLYAVGQAAVPLNMMILGCNLSLSFGGPGGGKGGKGADKKKGGGDSGVDGEGDDDDDSIQGRLLNNSTMAAIVIGKMVVMPIVGIVSIMVLRPFWNIPDEIDSAFYLVAMIVFITPTANNVMVMVELSGSGTKEGIARVIGWQYAVAPLLLSLSVTLVVGVASEWS